MIAAAAVVSLVEVVEAAASVLSFEEKTVESNNTISEFHVNGRCHIKTSTSDASNVFGGGL